jgi:hypothetical protein
MGVKLICQKKKRNSIELENTDKAAALITAVVAIRAAAGELRMSSRPWMGIRQSLRQMELTSSRL